MGEAALTGELAGCSPSFRYLHVDVLWEAALNSPTERQDVKQQKQQKDKHSRRCLYSPGINSAGSVQEAPTDVTAALGCRHGEDSCANVSGIWKSGGQQSILCSPLDPLMPVVQVLAAG